MQRSEPEQDHVSQAVVPSDNLLHRVLLLRVFGAVVGVCILLRLGYLSDLGRVSRWAVVLGDNFVRLGLFLCMPGAVVGVGVILPLGFLPVGEKVDIK